MADDKKDDKPKSKGSVLYDAPKGEPKRGSREAAAKKAEAKPDEKKEEPKSKEAEAAKPADAKKEGDAAPAKAADDKPAEKPKDPRAEVHKRHEVERRDFHNNQKESIRQMVTRHEKEIRALNEKAEGVAQPAEMVPGNMPAAPQAQALAAAAPMA